MKKSVRISLAAAGLALLAGMGIWFIPGMKFSAWLCGGIAAALLLWAGLIRWSEKSRGGKVCKVIFLACVIMGILSFAVVETFLVKVGRIPPYGDPPAAVVVLGAGVNGTTPSLVLASRLNAAKTYLSQIPSDTPVILSGGQGPGEDVTEAQAMYNYLTAVGISGERLYLEERSTTTAENLAYSETILSELGIDTYNNSVAVVTNDFHMARVRYLADFETPITVTGVPARLPYWWLTANYYTREYFALAKAMWNRLNGA
ncbi:YdcF family protein [Oscillibacter sp.]|uniref:YdcF family protein n=1 Tax=Oscillibacter sp. TaxID=1945593 RepID=UPI002898571D|nr:YdcF family protein [Oscillibacter sp.]